jgi:hypothetical protein
MTAWERLAEVFARGQSQGLASLTATERDTSYDPKARGKVAWRVDWVPKRD